MIKNFWPYLKPYKKYAILGPLCIFFEVVLDILIPFMMASIVDKGIRGDGGMPYIFKMGALMVLAALVSLTLGLTQARCSSLAATGFSKELRSALFSKVMDFSFYNVDKFSSASLVTRLTTDVTNMQNSLMMGLRIAFRAPFMLLFATIMAVNISGRLSLIFACVFPVILILFLAMAGKAFERFQQMLRRYDDMNLAVQENLTAIRVVKAFVREEHEKGKFSDRAQGVRRAQMAAEKLLVMAMPIMQMIIYICLLSVLYFGGHMVIAGNLELGLMSSYLTYVMQIMMSIMMLAAISVMLVLSRASLKRANEILVEMPDIADPEEAAAFEVKDGSVIFKDVSFSYSKDEKKSVLKNISFEIKSGETIGIIGATGSAKTSLVSLIPRLYDATGGAVLVGGVDVRGYKVEDLRQSVAMVLQNNLLFSGTIRENLRFGDETAGDDDIQRACKAAYAHEFIESFEDGYDTILGQGGVNLSGGQKQRLCIARALIKNPKILILDDATSAVDTNTDAGIRASLKMDLKDTTTIIIAQRVASVMDADAIVVLHDGEIDAIGTHEELLRGNEIYRDVYESQQKGVT